MNEIEYLCPSDAFLQIIKGKCKTTIIVLIEKNVNRFSELKRTLPSISERMLSTQLNELVEDGILTRQFFAQIPPRVEYTLTDYGKTLCPIIKEMRKWGYKHLDQMKDK